MNVIKKWNSPQFKRSNINFKQNKILETPTITIKCEITSAYLIELFYKILHIL